MAEFRMPEYYARFRCKGAACRNSCCVGWGISVSREEYRALKDAEYSSDLRRRIDSAFHIAENADTERYAAIVPLPSGDCPLRSADGLCALQKEKGEDALPAVCRLFPRTIQCDYERVCSCSASCEAVAEMLIAQKEPLRFLDAELRYADTALCVQAASQAVDLCKDARSLCLSILQNRSEPISDRMRRIAGTVRELAGYEQKGDFPGLRQAVDRAIDNAGRSPVPDDAGKQTEVNALFERFDLCMAFAGSFMRAGASLSALWPSIEAELRPEDSGATGRYRQMKAQFEQACPDWQIAFEQLLGNHVFYSRFPFSDRLQTLWDETLAFAAGYALLRFVCVMTARDGRPESLADAAAKTFRLTEHSDFDARSAGLLRRLGLDNATVIAGLLRLA